MLAHRAKESFQGAEEKKMNTKGRKQTLVITLAMMAALTVGSSMAFAQSSTPRIQANTTLALPDGSVLELTSRFRFDVDTNERGITTPQTPAW
jgi:ferric-dicitrate binding protein FerR (iron transport regulator)